MKVLTTVLALTFVAPSIALAAPLRAEDAVALLLAGVQDQGVTYSLNMTWEREAAGVYVGTSANPGKSMQMKMQVTGISGCQYETRGELVVDSQVVEAYAATYDFAEISSITLARPVMAMITGDNFCSSETASMCGKVIDLAVPMHPEDYNRVYTEFRQAHCP